MATALDSPVRNPKGKPTDKPGLSLRTWATGLLDSSVGAKFLIALTGIGLVGFVAGHLIGNLKLFSGPDSINAYAYFLKHDLGILIWLARGGLLTIFLLHVVLAIRLKLRANAARPVGYHYHRTMQATAASRTMIWTGIVILVFLLFHLAHYTFGWVKGVYVTDPATGQQVWKNYLELTDSKGRHDVYRMVIAGFRNPYISVFYIACQVLLFFHLRHGIASVFQTLGLNGPRFQPFLSLAALATAFLLAAGNIAIVVAVWARLVGLEGSL
jgi:succinate dehydrogenase / fumarate reductase cytochrome b subunit